MRSSAALATHPVSGRPVFHAGLPTLTRISSGLAEAILLAAILYTIGTLTPEFNPVDLEGLNTVRTHAVRVSESSIVNQLFWLSLAGLSALVVMSAPRRLLSILPVLTPMVVLCGFMLVSALWALAPDITFRRAVYSIILVFVVMVGVVYARSPKRVMQILFVAFFAHLLANLMAVPFGTFYHQGGEHAGLFRGILPHKNLLGASCTLALLVGLGAWRAKATNIERALWAFYMLGWAFTIWICGSKTAIGLAIVIPIAMVLMTGLRGFLPASRLTMIIAGLIVVGGLFLLITQGFGVRYETLMTSLGIDPTFTGRTYIWQFIVEKIEDRPLFGYGFHSFWGSGFVSPASRAPFEFIRVLNQAHSGYLDLLIHLGIVGTAIFVWMIGAFVFNLRQVGLYSSKYSFVIWCLFLFTLMHNFTETSFLRQGLQQWTVFLVIFFWAAIIHVELKARRKALAMMSPAARVRAGLES